MLLNTIKRAYKNIPFYYNVGQENNININDISSLEDFEKLPLIEKKDILKDFEKMIDPEYQTEKKNKLLTVIQTSGTTGECLNVFYTLQTYCSSLADLWIARKKRYDISSRDKCCTFYYETYDTERISSGVRFTINDKILSFSRKDLAKNKYIHIYNIMNKFRPVWMIIWPSIAINLMKCMKEYNLPKIECLKYIEFTGEYISKAMQSEISEFFGCSTANQYGTTESNSIAYECKNGNLHCMSDNVLVEILNNGKNAPTGQYGDVYITTLKNKVMPFIRYGIGDTARLIDGKQCSCGNCNPIIELQNSRKTSNIVCEDGTTINAYDLIHAVEFLNNRIWVVKQFSIVQDDFTNISIYIETSNMFIEQSEYKYEDLINMVLDNLDRKIYDKFKFNFHFVKDINEQVNLINKGKFQSFIPYKMIDDE